jgi:hypothetical protein
MTAMFRGQVFSFRTKEDAGHEPPFLCWLQVPMHWLCGTVYCAPNQGVCVLCGHRPTSGREPWFSGGDTTGK